MLGMNVPLRKLLARITPRREPLQAAARIDRATRLAAVILATFVLTLFGAASAMLLTGCHAGWPCDNHGGVKWTNSKLYECNDGTLE